MDTILTILKDSRNICSVRNITYKNSTNSLTFKGYLPDTTLCVMENEGKVLLFPLGETKFPFKSIQVDNADEAVKVLKKEYSRFDA